MVEPIMPVFEILSASKLDLSTRPDWDIHYFELQEESLGLFNKLKLEFCLKGSWFIA